MAANHPGHEYLPLAGLPEFRNGAQQVIFGAKSPLLSGPHVATVQAVSGSGAVHMAGLFIKSFWSPSAKVYVSDPSWTNHKVMYEFLGFQVADYPYYDAPNRKVDFEGMLKCLKQSEDGSVWILHSCAHNPTGYDLTQDQWKQVGAVIKEKGILPVLDSAYQGFASGDLDKDAWSIRYLLGELKLNGMVCQSFSKSMGLYGERVGAVHLVLPENKDPQVIDNAIAQLGWFARKEFSSSPRYGATIVATILADPRLYEQWQKDLVTMSSRIISVRKAVVENLKKLGTPGDWSHVTEQIGMFSYTGLSKEQVTKLKEKHIYMADNGRAALVGLNQGNVEYFCQCVDAVIPR